MRWLAFFRCPCVPATRNDVKGYVSRFICGYSHVFSASEFGLGRTSLLTHRINTGDVRPIHQGLRRHPQIYLDIIDQ